VALKAIGVTQSEDFSDIKDDEIPNLVNSLSKKDVISSVFEFSLFNKFKIFQIIQIASGGPNIDNQLVVEASAYINECFCNVQNFEIPFMVVGKIKSIANHYRSAAAEESETQSINASSNIQNTSDDIQRRVARWRGLLTVEFEKLFPNQLNGAIIVIDVQNFLAICPICRLSYSTISPCRNNSFYKRNFVDHLNREHLQTRNPLRRSVPLSNSNSNSDINSTLPNLNRQSLPIQLDTTTQLQSHETQETQNVPPILNHVVPRSRLPRLQTRTSSLQRQI